MGEDAAEVQGEVAGSDGLPADTEAKVEPDESISVDPGNSQRHARNWEYIVPRPQRPQSSPWPKLHLPVPTTNNNQILSFALASALLALALVRTHPSYSVCWPTRRFSPRAQVEWSEAGSEAMRVYSTARETVERVSIIMLDKQDRVGYAAMCGQSVDTSPLRDDA